MQHLPPLVHDLANILVTAACVTLIFRKLRQPMVLGYLIAGLLVGPHVTLMPTVIDPESIRVWADIGMIFLLFGLGLEFSFKKLAEVGKAATVTASFEVAAMLALGFAGGKWLGWSNMDSLFLGAILSISSTTIIVRAFEELGLKNRSSTKLVFGVLIVEDLLAILLLVLLASVAGTGGGFSGALLFSSIAKLGFFLIFCFAMGIYLLPWFLAKVRAQLSNETALIVSCGLCLAMVLVSERAGFSPALGAFLMGSILAETREGRRIEHLLMSVKDLFAAVFFVSVGMMIDPHALWTHKGVIAFLTCITIGGKFLSTAWGALVSGRSLKHSVEAGLSLAQIGEFSFIIATLGISQGVTSDFLYPIAVAVSAITTFCTPYMIQSSGSIYRALDAKLPAGLRSQLARYEVAVATPGPKGVTGILWDEYGFKLLLNSVMVVAVGIASSGLALPFLEIAFPEAPFLKVLVCIGTLFLSGPFLWAVLVGKATHQSDYDSATLLVLERMQNGILFLRLALATVLAAFVCKQFAGLSAIYGAILVLVSVVAVYFSRFAAPLYLMVEKKFLENLSERERSELARRAPDPILAPWSFTLSEFVLTPLCALAGQNLRQSALKEKFGVSVALIERGGRKKLAPGPEELLLPLDRVQIIGTDEQIASMKSLTEDPPSALGASDGSIFTGERFGLEAIRVKEGDGLDSRSVHDSGIRENWKGLLVGIERGTQRILNPESREILHVGDLLWVVGDRDLIREFQKK